MFLEQELQRTLLGTWLKLSHESRSGNCFRRPCCDSYYFRELASTSAALTNISIISQQKSDSTLDGN
jgi:hypothetical protein